MPEIVLATHALTKRFGKRVAVNNVSLEVHKGDIFGYLGPNGAGKSTSIRMILGLIRCSAGHVDLFGLPARKNHKAVMRRIGAIVESPTFYLTLSARQNLELFAALSGGAPKARIDEILELVGLRDRQHDKVRVFSSGMKQRLGIAQALLPNPELVILDEPTVGLDPRGVVEVREMIVHLRDARGITVFLSSHVLHEVQQICNRVAIIDQGGLRHQGSVAELVRDDHRVLIRVDRPAEALACLTGRPFVKSAVEREGALHVEMTNSDAAETNAALVHAGFRVSELRPLTESLEDVFLKLTAPGSDGASAIPPAPGMKE